ncbi:MAG: DNA polymerase III subunit delta [Snowella sp.]|nr:DNA polymerase III subunit delta [Snowella sp.]
MPVYFFWGEDDFTLNQAVAHLRDRVLDPNWASFNFEKIPGEQADATQQALSQAMTPPFGFGDRLVWVVESTLGQQCPDPLLAKLKEIFSSIPTNSHLLFTSSKKPDGRLKSTKLFQDLAQVKEFSLISPWKTEELVLQIQQIAQDLAIKLTPNAQQLLAESLGNNTRQIWNELKKLKLYNEGKNQTLDTDTVTLLINASTQNSLQLAEAIRQGNGETALRLVAELLARNEPALKIVATLVGQFRTWTAIKICLESGEKDEKVIAAAAELSNPKRLYFLRKELQTITGKQLLASLPLLLALEFQLKRGAEPLSCLQTKVLELCQIFSHQK